MLFRRTRRRIWSGLVFEARVVGVGRWLRRGTPGYPSMLLPDQVIFQLDPWIKCHDADAGVIT